MQIIQTPSSKATPCKKCGQQVIWLYIANDDGSLATKDGKYPNGMFGKDANTYSICHNVSDNTLHVCYEKYARRDLEPLGLLSRYTVPAIPSKNIEQQPVKMSVNWPVDEIVLTPDIEEIINGERTAASIAYTLAKDLHPDLDTSSNIFGQIVNAKETHVINLMLVRAIKKLKRPEPDE